MGSISILVPIIEKIVKCQAPGKKALQKLIYLISKKGVDFGFSFSIHYYGPYSSGLDNAIHSLQMQGVIEIVPDGMNQRIYLTELVEMVEAAELSPVDTQKIDEVLRAFGTMTAFELEVLTTTDFVARELCRGEKTCSDEVIVEGVKKIKGTKFTNERIKQAIEQLRENGYHWN